MPIGKTIGTLLAAMAGFLAVAAEVQPVTVCAARENAVYRSGEEIEFKIDAASTEGLQYTVNSGGRDSARLPVSGNIIRVKAERPGFLLVKVFYSDAAGKKKVALGGAAVEPEAIRPGRPCPADFDAFWEKQLKELDRHPLKVVSLREIRAPRQPAGIRLYDVKLEQAGIVATGFLAVPKDAAPHSLPAVAAFSGASKVSAEPPAAWGPAARIPAICFNLNFQGLENLPARDPARERELRKQLSPNYTIDFADDPEQYAMRKICLRVVMALNFLKSRPEFDGAHLVAQGGSLGGFQAMVGAALVPEVTYCVACASAMCNHHGAEAGHLPGFPNLLRRNPKALDTAAYFDGVNFASRIRCPIVMAVGFVDTVCPPASTYSAYNMLTVKDRHMIHLPTCGHGGSVVPSRKANVFSCAGNYYIEHCRKRQKTDSPAR